MSQLKKSGNKIINPYLPTTVRIHSIREETSDVRTFVIEPLDGTISPVFDFKPGQFAIWSLPGIGEAPFSYSAPTSSDYFLEFTIHRTGKVTNAIFQLQAGDLIGLRGPYGNGFPLEKMEGRNLLFVMGGIGSAPLRGVLHHVLRHPENFGSICVFYGAKTPAEMLFRSEFESYTDDPRMTCMLTVDEATREDDWDHETGVVTVLFDRYQEKHDKGEIFPENTSVMICGPPIMYKFVIEKLVELGIPQDQIFMTLERRMKCGIGKCGHCVIDFVYACTHGPVFTYWDAKNMKDVI